MRYILLFSFLFILSVKTIHCQDVTAVDFDKAKTLLSQHNYRKVISLCNEKISSAIKKNDAKTHSLFLSVKGFAYLDTLSADSGKIFLEKSLTEAYGCNYKKSIYNALHGLGKYYYRNTGYKTS